MVTLFRSVALSVVASLTLCAVTIAADEKPERPRRPTYTDKINEEIEKLRKQISEIDEALGDATPDGDGDKASESSEKSALDDAEADAKSAREDAVAARKALDEAQKEHVQARLALRRQMDESQEIKLAAEELQAAKAAYDAVAGPLFAALKQDPQYVEAARNASRARVTIKILESRGGDADRLAGARNDLAEAEALMSSLEEAAAAKAPQYASLKTAYEAAQSKHDTLIETLDAQSAVTTTQAAVEAAQQQYDDASRRAGEASREQAEARRELSKVASAERADAVKMKRLHAAKAYYEKQIESLQEKKERYEKGKKYSRNKR